MFILNAQLYWSEIVQILLLWLILQFLLWFIIDICFFFENRKFWKSVFVSRFNWCNCPESLNYSCFSPVYDSTDQNEFSGDFWWSLHSWWNFFFIILRYDWGSLCLFWYNWKMFLMFALPSFRWVLSYFLKSIGDYNNFLAHSHENMTWNGLNSEAEQSVILRCFSGCI